jgi:hypothetical protein
MACSPEYKALVVTSDGDTPENPYGFYPTPYDFDGWASLVRRLLLRTSIHLARLEAASKDEDATQATAGYTAELNALQAAAENLPSPWTCCFHEQQTISNIDDAASIALNAACLMEEIDKTLASAGLKPPVEPRKKPAKTPAFKLGTVGMLAAVGVGAYLYWKAQ